MKEVIFTLVCLYICEITRDSCGQIVMNILQRVRRGHGPIDSILVVI